MAYKIISISLTPAQAKALNRRLKELGLGRSQYVRGLLNSDGVSPTGGVLQSSTAQPESPRPAFRSRKAAK